MTETLSAKQQRFVKMVGDLIIWTYEQPGHTLTFGEAWRTPEQAAIYAAQGKGIKSSLHLVRLAIDLNLFKAGRYCDKTEDYEELGRYFESLGGCWGGSFLTRPDGNHFSLPHGGRK